LDKWTKAEDFTETRFKIVVFAVSVTENLTSGKQNTKIDVNTN